MAYKGKDLDLRLGYPAGGLHSGAATSGVATPPIVVDELVVSCCNGAYDAARFHASREVRLEHLLHAMTRVTAASDILAALGINVDHLRRDTAGSIAAAIPAGSMEGVHAPVASAALEDLLRRAADMVSTWRLPASVHDLLRTVLRSGPDQPAAMLLMQAATDPHRLGRWRDETLARAEPHPQLALAQPEQALGLHARLDLVESSLRLLSAEAAADRKIMIEALMNMQSELQALRSVGGHAFPLEQARAISDSVRGVHGELQAFRAEREQTPPLAALDTKLGALSQSLDERFTIIDKLADGEALQPILERIDTVQELLDDHSAEVSRKLVLTLSETVSNALTGRLAQSETAIKGVRDEVNRLASSNGERQIALEASIRAQLQAAEEATKTHDRDLGEIYDALVKLGTNQQTLGDNFGTWRLENSGDVGIISNRLKQFEQTSLEMLTRLTQEVAALRQETAELASRGSNGFKRWLYGTDHVLAAGWRRGNGTEQAPNRLRTEEKS